MTRLKTRFAATLVRLGPFEPAPVLAVAVSGGADSLALALLADGWARARGGRVIGLVVDHGVRPAAGLEVPLVAAWLAARGIEARTLRLAAPGRSAQALRRARLQALARAAGEAGTLHLLLGHHALDQAETVLLRLARGSGERGLAGMAETRAVGPVRLLRPLLGEAPSALQALLRATGQPWVEDPSNTGQTTRARLRAALRDRHGEGVAVRAALEVAITASRRRREAAETLARSLAEAVQLSPLGFALLDAARFAAWTEPLQREALAALLRCVGGHHHPVRGDRLTALLSHLQCGKGATAAGCLVAPRGRAMLIAREPAAAAPPVVIGERNPVWWDRRWRVWALPGDSVGAVGAAEAAALRRVTEEVRCIPSVVLATLPAIRRGGVLVAVPPILYDRGDGGSAAEARFRPPEPLVTGWEGGAERGSLEAW